MELIEARKKACQEFGFEFEKVFRRGRPSDDVVSAKKKMETRIAELMGGEEVVPEKPVEIVTNRVLPRRVATPETKPLHECKFDVNLSTVPMKYFDKFVPIFLKRSKS